MIITITVVWTRCSVNQIGSISLEDKEGFEKIFAEELTLELSFEERVKFLWVKNVKPVS